jgi:hypothetical protein
MAELLQSSFQFFTCPPEPTVHDVRKILKDVNNVNRGPSAILAKRGEFW